MNSSKTDNAVICLILSAISSLGFGAWQESLGAGIFIFVVFVFVIIEKVFDWK